jgi:hypothetical protein
VKKGEVGGIGIGLSEGVLDSEEEGGGAGRALAKDAARGVWEDER